MTLVPVDASNEASVITLLERAAQWLSEAVHRGEPGEVAAVKAQLATAAEATRQLGLSKEIQLDAQEMVRRAEYALARAIRRGQEEGLIRKHGEQARFYDRHSGVYQDVTNPKSSPTDFATKHELAGVNGGDGAYAMADHAEPEEFDEVLAEAKEEGNLSRANVVRKIKERSTKNVVTRDMRAEQIAILAEQGYSSRQMPAKVGVTEETVRLIARDFNIEIPADRSISRTRRVDSNRIVANTVTALEGLVMGVELVEYGDLDPREASQWADSLTHSLRALNRFVKQIKETTHD